MDLSLNKSAKLVIEEILHKEGFVDYTLQLIPAAAKCVNHLSVPTKIKITGRKLNNEESTLNLFCKLPVTSSVLRKMMQLNDHFVRESLVYEQIIPDFKTFERENNITKGFKSFVKCIGTNSEDEEEFLILEDISIDGYVMFNTFSNLDVVHVELAMREMSKFHAISFALKDQKPEIINKYKGLHELIFRTPVDNARESYSNTLIENVVKSIHLEGFYQEKWVEFYSNCSVISRDCVNGALAEPHAVICHGDFWNNNIMFKYDKGLPVDIKVFDWQITRYASPVTDLAYYLFVTIQKPLRSLYYDHLITVYYKSLSEFMKALGSDADKVFPFSALQDQLKKFGKFGLIMAVFVLPITYKSYESNLNFTDLLKNNSVQEDTQNGAAEISDECKQRLTDIIIDLVDLGYL